jgi:peptide/nickel transport system substrate-binding protein
MILAVVMAGCATAQRPEGERSPGLPVTMSQRLTAAVGAEPATLSTTVVQTGPGGTIPGLSDVEQFLHAGLAVKNDRGALVPRLADMVPTVDNGRWRVEPDGRMETVWRVKPTISWHDGAPFSVEDLLFTAQVGRDKDVPLSRHVAYAFIQSVEMVDPATVAVRWQRPFIQADMMFTPELAMPLPRHLLERTYLDDKPSLLQLPYWTHEFVGLGPFKLREWVRGSHLVLEANDQYVAGRPRIDEIEVRFINDPNVRVANILAGAVHLTLGPMIAVEQAIQIRDQWREGRIIVALSSPIALFPQLLDPHPAAIMDVRFRRALLHAIDRQQLIDLMQEGLSAIPHSLLNPGEPEFQDVESSAVRYDHDVRRAVQLIESLGYTRGSDGMFRDAASQELAIEIWSLTSFPMYERSALAVAGHWQGVGVRGTLFPIPIHRQQDREHRSTFPGFDLAGGGGGDVNFLARLRISETPVPENNFLGRNKTRYRNPELDGLIERFFVTVPWQERMDVLRGVIHHMTDQVVFLPLFYPVEPRVAATRLELLAPTRATRGTLAWNSHEWHLGG